MFHMTFNVFVTYFILNSIVCYGNGVALCSRIPFEALLQINIVILERFNASVSCPCYGRCVCTCAFRRGP